MTPPSRLKWIHLTIGILVLLAFLAGRLLQYLGSALLLAAAGLFLYGFFIETPLAVIERPMIRRGIYWSLYGALLHETAGVLQVREAQASSAGAVMEKVST